MLKAYSAKNLNCWPRVFVFVVISFTSKNYIKLDFKFYIGVFIHK